MITTKTITNLNFLWLAMASRGLDSWLKIHRVKRAARIWAKTNILTIRFDPVFEGRDISHMAGDESGPLWAELKRRGYMYGSASTASAASIPAALIIAGMGITEAVDWCEKKVWNVRRPL